MTQSRPQIDAPVGELTFPLANQDGTVTVGTPRDRWTMLFVYRGKHCPRCKRYLNKLNAALPAWTDLLDVVVVSADPEAKAKADLEEFGWHFPLAYDLSEEQMRSLGLYVSDPISEAETDRRFAEPGTFAIRPDGTLMLVDISNGPASRPDLEELLDGMNFNITNNRPARGKA